MKRATTLDEAGYILDDAYIAFQDTWKTLRDAQRHVHIADLNMVLHAEIEAHDQATEEFLIALRRFIDLEEREKENRE